MNYSIQNNTDTIKFVSIQIIDVTFIQVEKDSSINNLLDKLKVAYHEFDSYLTLEMPVIDIKKKAIEINSTVKTLIETINKIEKSNDFIKKMIESTIAITKRYEDAITLNGFNHELHDELVSICNSSFNKNFGRHIDNSFWWNLHFYEWANKEGFVASQQHSYWQPSFQRSFSDEQLEEFFNKNRTDVIKSMLKCERQYNEQLQIVHPLSNSDTNCYFDLYKKLPKPI